MQTPRDERLANQMLIRPAASPAAVVSALGAVQAQEYAWAKWGLAVRSREASDAGIEDAFARGDIVRTHAMRMTHHFVARGDVRWLLHLIRPRTLARVASRHRELGLDAKTLVRAASAISRALEGGHAKTRDELGEVLRRAKIAVAGQRLPHILAHAEVTSLVCSGPRRGKQITFMLLDERVPAAAPRPRSEALAELATRYFTTRGPATVGDFVWWSSLTAAEARAAIGEAGLRSAGEYIRGKPARGRATGAHLLPPFDEYLVSYQRRDLAGVAPAGAPASEKALLAPMVVIAGEVIGSWRRAPTGPLAIDITAWRRLSAAERGLVDDAAQRFASFVGRSPAALRWA